MAGDCDEDEEDEEEAELLRKLRATRLAQFRVASGSILT